MIRRFFYRRQLPLVLLLCVFAVEHYWIKQSWGLKENFNLAGHPRIYLKLWRKPKLVDQTSLALLFLVTN
jgi:hypothetical protein